MAKLSGLWKFFVNRSNERNSKRFFHAIRNYLTLDGSSSCLELGSGKGFLSYLVYHQYRPGRIVVTDYDPSQVEEAEQLFESELGTVPTNVEFRSADALDLPFQNEMFDAIFAMMILHHTEKKDWQFRNIPKALEEILRVLRPGGIFCYTELFSKNRIRNYLSNAGFQEILSTRSYFLFDSCVYRKESPARSDSMVRLHGLEDEPAYSVTHLTEPFDFGERLVQGPWKNSLTFRGSGLSR